MLCLQHRTWVSCACGDWGDGALQPAIGGWTGTNHNKHGGSHAAGNAENNPNTFGTHSIDDAAKFRVRMRY